MYITGSILRPAKAQNGYAKKMMNNKEGYNNLNTNVKKKISEHMKKEVKLKGKQNKLKESNQ